MPHILWSVFKGLKVNLLRSNYSYSMLTVTNTGAVAPATVSASIEPAAAQSLFVLGIYLNATVFTPNHAVQIPIFFYPTSAGRFNAELVLTISGNTSNKIPLDFGLYHAPGIGRFAETIRIICDDPVTPEAAVILEGGLGGAKGRINPEFIDFSGVSISTAARRATTFENTGTVDLHIMKIVWQSGNEFKLVQTPALPYTVAAGLLSLSK